MKKGPYKRRGKGWNWLLKKPMPSRRKLLGFGYVPGFPGFYDAKWVWKNVPMH